MKVITIRQPWAHLIVHGIKKIENRSWPTSYRGPLLIHAGLGVDKDAMARFRMSIDRVQRGGIIGVAQLVDIVDKSDDPFFGPLGWILKDARRIPFVPLKGRLGLFDPPERFKL